jgi:dynein light chain Tctex-type 1
MMHLVLRTLQAAFVADDVSNIIKESLDTVLLSKQYNVDKVGKWANECMENCVKRLTSYNKPFKYVVTCLIMQKTGAGLHTAASCFWDNSTDGSRTVRWENKTMYCICSVFGLAL